MPKVRFLRRHTREKKEREANGETAVGMRSMDSRQTLLRKRPSSSSVSGLLVVEDPDPSVPMRKVLQLERLMKEQGIDSDPLFKEAGIDKKAKETTTSTDGHRRESIVSFAERAEEDDPEAEA